MSSFKTEFFRRDATRHVAPFQPSSASLQGPDSGELDLLVADLKAVAFSPYIAEWIEGYEKVGQRSRFLWQWCLKGIDLTTLPCVDPSLRVHVMETKLLGIMYCTLVDDLADRDQDAELLDMAMKLASDHQMTDPLAFWGGRRQDYLQMISRIWEEVWSRCSSYPRFREFEQILRFDNEQTLNAMRYALLVNHRPEVLNLVEHDLYQPHNMQMMFMATVDLCASPRFSMNDLGAAREVFWHTQRMGRIGNMITTWEREVLDRDFTSGIFAHAMNLGVLTGAGLRELPAHEIMARLEEASCQEVFIQDWKQHRDCAAKKINTVRSVDLKPYLRGFEEMFKLHLCGRGHL